MPDKTELIDALYERLLLNDDEEIILSEGFESALIGISSAEPKVAIYDFWKALDCVIKEAPEMSFDQCLEWLEDFSSQKIENSESLTPLFIKTL
jgi:hypothetical protein|tara:strand:+ start:1130 stop:1411 length:282 start_codon:yes stop_codon:yes gene_type:complete